MGIYFPLKEPHYYRTIVTKNQAFKPENQVGAITMQALLILPSSYERPTKITVTNISVFVT